MSSKKPLKRFLTQEARLHSTKIFNTESEDASTTSGPLEESALSILLVACLEGNLDQLKELILMGQDINEISQDGDTPLISSIECDNLEIAKFLLEQGADPDLCSEKTKVTPLMAAAYNGHHRMVTLLLSYGAKISIAAISGNTALHCAASNGHLECVRLIIETLEKGEVARKKLISVEGNVSSVAKETLIALSNSSKESGGIMSVKNFLSLQNEVEHDALMEACAKNRYEVVKYLASKGADVNSYSSEFKESPLIIAAYKGYANIVKFLVDNGANMEHKTDEMHTPLIEASIGGHLDVAKILIDAGANVDAAPDCSESPLSAAANRGHIDLMALFIAHGANIEGVTEEGYTPLMEACREEFDQAAGYLLALGANVNAITAGSHETALTIAASTGSEKVVNLLIQHGAAVDLGATSPLMEAAEKGHLPIVRILLQYNADANRVSYFAHSQPDVLQSLNIPIGETALQCALDNGHLEIAYELIVNGRANVEHVPETGITFLMKAAKTDQLKMVRLLVEIGKAKLDVTSAQQEHTALSYACSGGHYEVVNYLLAKGAKRDVRLKDNNNCYLEAVRSGHVKLIQLIQGQIPMDTSVLLEPLVLASASSPEDSSNTTNEKPASGDKLITTRPLFMKDMSHCKSQHSGITPDMISVTLPNMPESLLSLSQKESFDIWLDKLLHITTDTMNTITSANCPVVVPPLLSSHLIYQLVENLKQAQAVLETTEFWTNNDFSPQMQRIDRINEALQTIRKLLPPTAPLMMNAAANHLNNNAADELSSTSSAAAGTNTSMEEFTPKFHFDINCCVTSTGENALHLACASNHVEVVEYLLSIHVNVEHRDKKFGTALHVAVYLQHVDIVRMLLSHGADINATTDKTKESPLLMAASNGCLILTTILLEHGANKEFRNAGDYTALCLASSGGHSDVVECLLQHGADVNSSYGSKLGITPLMLAAMSGRLDCVKILLDHGADINAQIETNQNTALTLANYQDRADIVRLLAKRGANVEHRYKTGFNPLMEAAEAGYISVGRALLECGADVNPLPGGPCKAHPLTLAAEKGHTEFVSLLLKWGAQVEAKNKRGATALFLAASAGHVDCVDILLKYNACADTSDNRQICALLVAFRNGHSAVVKLLLEKVENIPSAADLMKHQLQVLENADEKLKESIKQSREYIENKREEKLQKADMCRNDLLKMLALEDSNKRKKDELAAKKRDRKRIKKQQKRMEKEKKGDDGAVMAEEKSTDIVLVPIPSDFPAVEVDQEVGTNKLSLEAEESNALKAGSSENVSEKDRETPSPSSMSSPPLTERTSANVVLSKSAIFSTTTLATVSMEADDLKNDDNFIKPAALKSLNGKEPIPPLTMDATRLRTTNNATKKEKNGKKPVTMKIVTGKKETLMTIPVPKQMIGRVIGQGGQTINAIRSKTLASIEIASDKDTDSHGHRQVTVKGIDSQVRRACELIQSIIDGSMSVRDILEVNNVVDLHRAPPVQQQQQQQQQPSVEFKCQAGNTKKSASAPTALPIKATAAELPTNSKLLPSTSVWASSGKKGDPIKPPPSTNTVTTFTPDQSLTVVVPANSYDKVSVTPKKAAFVSPMVANKSDPSVSPVPAASSTFSPSPPPSTSTPTIPSLEEYLEEKEPERTFCRAPGSDRFALRQKTNIRNGNNCHTPLATVSPYVPNATDKESSLSEPVLAAAPLVTTGKCDAFGLLLVDDTLDVVSSTRATVVTDTHLKTQPTPTVTSILSHAPESTLGASSIFSHFSQPFSHFPSGFDESQLDDIFNDDASFFPSILSHTASNVSGNRALSPFVYESSLSQPSVTYQPPIHSTNYVQSTPMNVPPPPLVNPFGQHSHWQAPVENHLFHHPDMLHNCHAAAVPSYSAAPSPASFQPGLGHHYVSNSATSLRSNDFLPYAHFTQKDASYLEPVLPGNPLCQVAPPLNSSVNNYVPNPWQYITHTPR